MKKLSIFGSGVFTFLALPAVVSAGEDLGEVTSLLRGLLNTLDVVVLIVFALALIFFLWGLAKFILNAGDEEERGKGKQIMLWGIIALVVMSAVWGIVKYIGDTVGIEEGLDPIAPGIPIR